MGGDDQTNPVRAVAASAVYAARSMVGRFPALALPLARLERRGEIVDASTDIVIEGFPSSANTFAVAAFRAAQAPRACRIAHHTHAVAQVVRASRLGVPSIVLVRDPQEAVLSLVARSRSLRIPSALRGYVRFYGRLRRSPDAFVVGPFDEVVSSFGSVIARVNERFGTGFAEFAHGREDLDRIAREIEAHERTRRRTDEDLERMIPRPSEARARRKRALRDAYGRAPIRLRGEADELFAELRALS